MIAVKNSVEVYAWAPKPYHKFMAFKVNGRTQIDPISAFSVQGPGNIWLAMEAEELKGKEFQPIGFHRICRGVGGQL